MAVATLTLLSTTADSTSAVFSFLTATTPQGFPLGILAHQEEELTSAGIDGRRWRTVFDQYTPVTMETLADFATYGAAITEAQKYHRARGRLANLNIVLGNTTIAYQRLHVLDCQVRVSPGATVGAGVTSGAGAVIFATWSIVATQTTE